MRPEKNLLKGAHLITRCVYEPTGLKIVDYLREMLFLNLAFGLETREQPTAVSPKGNEDPVRAFESRWNAPQRGAEVRQFRIGECVSEHRKRVMPPGEWGASRAMVLVLGHVLGVGVQEDRGQFDWDDLRVGAVKERVAPHPDRQGIA